MSEADQTPRERLLEALLEHVGEHGFADMSLRALAATVGTSDRMLSYHLLATEDRPAVDGAMSRFVGRYEAGEPSRG